MLPMRQIWEHFQGSIPLGIPFSSLVQFTSTPIPLNFGQFSCSINPAFASGQCNPAIDYVQLEDERISLLMACKTHFMRTKS